MAIDRLAVLRLRREGDARAARAQAGTPRDDDHLPLVAHLPAARILYERRGDLCRMSVTALNGEPPRTIAAEVMDVWYCNPRAIDNAHEFAVNAWTATYQWGVQRLACWGDS